MNNLLIRPQRLLKKIGILGSLYVAQFLPIAFFLQTLPAFMRQQGMSVEVIGLTSFLGLPWMLKFLWSPLVDRYSLAKIGHYKSWIVAMQGLMVLVLILCALLNLETHFWLALVGMLLIGIFASTQDIAVDALAIGLLTPQERGLGNAIQTGGNYLGAILGGGVLLVLLGFLGWTGGLLGMAGCVLILIMPVLMHQESCPSSVSLKAGTHPSGVNPVAEYLRTFTRFCRRPGVGRWLILLLLYASGASMTNTMFRPLLIDIGLSLSEIGWMYGTAAYSAGLVGAVIGGILIKPLGRKRSLILFTLLLAGVTLLHVLPTLGFTSLPMLYFVSSAFNLTYSMMAVALGTLMMDKTRSEMAGTDYTLQVTLLFIGNMIAAGISGFMASAMGYGGVFVVSGGVTVVNAIAASRILNEQPVRP
ncbi:MAG: MFS transporter [Cyanobacteria bacterium J06639_16]